MWYLCSLCVLTAVGVTTPESVEFLHVDGGIVISHDGCTAQVSLAAPKLVFDAGETPPSVLPTTDVGDLVSSKIATVSYPAIPIGAGRLEMTLCLQWSSEDNVLRKRAWFRLQGTEAALLLREVILDTIAGESIAYTPSPPQSYPAFWKGFYAGIEFPVAATRVEGSNVVLAHRPGLVVRPGVWYETRKAIYGIAKPGEERTAFMAYITAHRPIPRGLHYNYNSWWTSSVPFTEGEILGLMQSFEDNLHKAHGVALDTFAIDMGWSQPKSIWDIDTALFPEGFTRISEASERMHARLGLWTSPSSFYPPALDTEWAKEQGYETTPLSHASGATRICCLGGERYSGAYRDRLVEMVTRYGVRHIKLDGYALFCDQTGHGHQPGDLAPEALAEGGIRAFEAVREAAPDTWLEATCFGWNPSPWWLFHVNSVIGTFGDDAPHGRSPSPVYRESYTTARDFFNLQGAALLPIPDAAQEVLGIIHQSQDPFLNDGVTTLLRGHAFVPLYINPKFMDARRWKQLADLMSWGRANADVLADTVPILPVSWRDGKVPAFVNDAPMPREPYGYAHWLKNRGIVLLRNPWMTPATIDVPIDVRPGTAPLTAVSLYPEARRYARDVQPGATLDIPLAPYETLVLSIAPDATADTLPDAHAVIGTQLDVRSDASEVARVEYTMEGPALGPDWICRINPATPTLRFVSTASVEVLAGEAQLLVLLEGPGVSTAPRLHAEINGAETKLALVSSDAGFAASTIEGTEHWAFYGAGLPQGTSRISLKGEADGEGIRISAWVFATKPGAETAAYANALPTPEVLYLDAGCLLECPEVAAVSNVLRESAPVERINGVFLDTLDPESETQGWGKLERNQSVWGKPLRIAGQQYVRGLGAHAPSRIVYALDGTYKRLQALAGADSAVNGTITFEVWADGKKLWSSDTMTRNDAPESVDVDITNARRLELIVGDAGNGIGADHADWAEAKLLR
ncbi:MAG: NPCBM/NEW2 domain-containing protein [Candidatus Hydrogenedentes bacterium]|nr:NPCBM/NEW2 domain-containing protein [Candidatus Hydrogenedentota bacterium]